MKKVLILAVLLCGYFSINGVLAVDSINSSSVPLTCENWYDGCNNCGRIGDETVCTNRYCESYGEPRCLKSQEPRACTEEAKLCSDGKTYVSRTGPNCEFQECPSSPPVDTISPVVCTQEAKLCSDGKTYVGRTGPNCEFEECPSTKPRICTKEYAPVCGQPPMGKCPEGLSCSQVMPNPKTYSNLCTLKGNGAKFLYSGECRDDKPTTPGIPETCKNWFDGCNSCAKVGNDYACTQRYCFKYEEPRCLDEDDDVLGCTEEYAPVCGKKYPDGDEIGGIVYKTFGNRCQLNINKDGYVFDTNGKCSENRKSYGLSEEIRNKLDVLGSKFLTSLESKYGTNTEKKISVLKNVIRKLEELAKQKSRYKNLVNYLVDIFEIELNGYEGDDLGDIYDILN